MGFKKVLVGIVVVVSLWFGGKFILGLISARQVGEASLVCAKQLDYKNKFQLATSDEEKKDLIRQNLQCINDKIGFPATLFFDLAGIIREMERDLNQSGGGGESK